MPPPTHCTATTAKGTPCRAWAVPGSNPPTCAAHGAGSRPPGAPDGNHNRQTHGAYTTPTIQSTNITQIIADLDRRLAQLSRYIDERMANLDPRDYATMTALQGQLASRLGRLLRDQQQLQGDDANQISQAINQALDQLNEEWGIEL